VHAANASAVSDVRPERAASWRRKAVLPAMLLVLAAAAVTWLQVVRTIRDPDPLTIPARPPVAGIVWSNRVFIHERSLKRWFQAHGRSYAVWARNHPRAVAVLRDRPLPPAAAPSKKPRSTAATATTESDDVGLIAFALLISGLLGAAALLFVGARRAVVVVRGRSRGLAHVSVPSLGRRSRARERPARSSGTEHLKRLYDAFAEALETLRDYRLRGALWALTAIIAAAGVTFLITQATQP
jgi:hypothetical protein